MGSPHSSEGNESTARLPSGKGVRIRQVRTAVYVLILTSLHIGLFTHCAHGQTRESIPEISSDAPPTTSTSRLPTNEFKKMTLDELMDVEVTSVSRRSEKLAETASAIQVVTGEDIRRSGATNLPEALRLAPNLQVAQLNSYGWIISSRGFNAPFANKLLVMIDGRTVYTPLFAGVFWDVQNVVLEDIDRIEVISGPGGSLWGANAVNGVINVVTKSAKETQGLYVTAAAGSYLEDWGAVRYGGSIGDKFFYRVYGQRFDRDNTFLPGGTDNADAWDMTNGGFRMDYYPSDADTFTFQGDVYGGNLETNPGDSPLDGNYLLGRWTHTFSRESDLSVQVYYDRTWRRDSPSTLTDKLSTYDIDIQHRFPLGERQSIIWGAGYRLMQSDVESSNTFIGFVPEHRDMELFSGFIQDEITLVPDRLKLTLGTKLEHNDFSGYEVQPSGRLAWTFHEQQMVWGAISRAVRTPSRIDEDLHIPTFPVPQDSPSVAGGPNFDSEEVVAYELGYRVQPMPDLSLSLAGFYNRYDDIYGVEALPGTQTFQIQNVSEGESWGAELAGTYQPLDWLRLRGGYTYLHVDVWNKPGHDAPTASQANDPQHQFLVQSMVDLPGNFQFDVTARYVSSLPDPSVPSYFTFDARLAWQYENVEFAIVGQNLADNRHVEFRSNENPGNEIPSSVYGKVTVRW